MATPTTTAGLRQEGVLRYLQLRPLILARMEASVPSDLQAEFAQVTAHQLRALAALPDDGLSMRQLASTMEVMGATASVLADRLVGQGLAVRASDPRDRRVVRLMPSERGRALSERYRQAERHAAEALFDRLTDEQVVAWLDVLETLAADDADPGADPRDTPSPG